MSRRTTQERIHSLEIPLKGISLLLPSAAVAEVTNPAALSPVPGGPPWLLGVFGWRLQTVPIVSLEVLMGQTVASHVEGAKIVVFYPLRGAKDMEFFGLLSAGEPRPQSITAESIESLDNDALLDSPFIASGLKLKERTLLIPDFDALRKAFYP
ncbi:MAG: chemotaxis protein CheW [Gammaproteobacteria bacterium]|nr:chemotaxis protein CheW [Gammaproteobacteria bacterium]